MNILFLNSLAKPKWGGGEKWMISAGEGLVEYGNQVTIACIAGSEIEQKAKDVNLKIWHFHIPSDLALWKARLLKSFLLQNKVDVLICCQNKDVRIGAKVARKIGIKAIFARQGIQNISNKKKYIKSFTQYIDGIITNTTSIKEIYESFGWFPENFIHVIYNGVELKANLERINLHEKLQLSKDAKIVFSDGRLDYQKGFDLLIQVAQLAKEQRLNWHIVVAGEGKLKSDLENLAEKHDVSDNFHLIGFSNQIPELLKSCDVFVLPSRYEGMPNALLEAMAMGKASVATAVNGAPELLEDGKSGFLVESENIDQIFNRLKDLLTNEKLRKSMEKEAFERVKNHFTLSKMSRNLHNLFEAQIEKY